jgi:autotransporter-associated beta strand protein
MNRALQTVNVNSKSLSITNSPLGVSGLANAANEGTGYGSLELSSALGTLTVQNGILDLETTAFNSGNYGVFRFTSSAFVNFASTASLIVGSNVLLFVNNPFNAAASPALTINDGGFVDMCENSLTVNSLSGGGNLAPSLIATNVHAETLTINGASGTNTFSGTLQNGPGTGETLAVTKTGGSTQVLSGHNNYTGATAINGGVLQLAGGSGSVLTTTSSITMGGGTLDLNGQVQANDYLTVNAGSTSVITDSSAGGLGVLTATNAGTTGVLVDPGFTLTMAGGTLNSSAHFLVNGGTLNMNGGTINIPNTLYCPYNNASGALVKLNSGVIKALTVAIGTGGDPGAYYFNGGTLTTANFKQFSNGVANVYFNGAAIQFIASSVFTPQNAPFIPYTNSAALHYFGTLQPGQNFYVSTNGFLFNNEGGNTFIGCPLQTDPNLGGTPDGGLTLSGTGTLRLTNAVNTYTGPTIVNAGTLMVNGTLAGAGAVTVGTNATLDGNGTIGGATTVQSGGTIQPGLGGTDTSTLTINNNLTLAGNAVFTLNGGNAQITGLGTVAYGGTLTVTNMGSAPALSNSFTLFRASAYTGYFTATNLPALASGLVWLWTPANGTLSVVSAAPPTTPTNITFTVSGGTLNLAWPPSYVGWIAQSNSVDVSNTNDWFDISGSGSGSNLSITLDPSQTNVFFRLRYPQ